MKIQNVEAIGGIMNSLITKAYAKINLGLDVLRRREDGYHDLRMIMQSVDLYDLITIVKSPTRSIHVESNLPYLPVDGRNIVYRAAQMFRDRFKLREGVNITIEKNIPVAAGLAGGSSDAAATLCALNKIYQIGLSTADLMKMGVKLGADVPYCIMMGTALSEGIGEILTPLNPMPDCDILLVKPDVSVSTKYVYTNLKLTPYMKHPDITSMRKAIEKGNLQELTKHMDNMLETVTIAKYPIISQIKQRMCELGALTALMSGSGPTVFGIYANPSLAQDAYEHFKKSDFGRQVFLVKPFTPEERIDE
jgi:4-diphosphocytidyl-2-C-methyl-D-erythritol kinase